MLRTEHEDHQLGHDLPLIVRKKRFSAPQLSDTREGIERLLAATTDGTDDASLLMTKLRSHFLTAENFVSMRRGVAKDEDHLSRRTPPRVRFDRPI